MASGCVIIMSWQFVMFLLFLIFVRYDGSDEMEDYPLFQDIHVMVFVGFGFLMTFLRRYAFSSMGFNFLLGALMLQWSILCGGIQNLNEAYKIPINFESLFKADIMTCSVLISMGVIVGTSTYQQLLMMGVIEVLFLTLNMEITSKWLKACDTGGSVTIHMFGAYFGMGVSWVFGRRTMIDSENECSRYNSDIFAMIGTLFLWLYWPSFNGIALPPDLKTRAIMNTYLSLASCCVTVFAMSSWFHSDRKFQMTHIQNSTLAGGVAIGSSASLLVQPYGAIFVGIFAGILSVVSFAKLTPWLTRRWRIQDTCGVNNLHGLPGIFGGFIGTFMAILAEEGDYGPSLYELYPGRSPAFSEPKTNATTDYNLENQRGRGAIEQAGFQILSVIVTLSISSISGIITGLFINCERFQLNPSHYFLDIPFWKTDYDLQFQGRIEVMPKTKSQLQFIPIRSAN